MLRSTPPAIALKCMHFYCLRPKIETCNRILALSTHLNQRKKKKRKEDSDFGFVPVVSLRDPTKSPASKLRLLSIFCLHACLFWLPLVKLEGGLLDQPFLYLSHYDESLEWKTTRQHKVVEVACYRLERTLLGCSMEVGAPH